MRIKDIELSKKMKDYLSHGKNNIFSVFPVSLNRGPQLIPGKRPWK